MPAETSNTWKPRSSRTNLLAIRLQTTSDDRNTAARIRNTKSTGRSSSTSNASGATRYSQRSVSRKSMTPPQLIWWHAMQPLTTAL